MAAAEQSAQASQTTQAESSREAGTSEEEITLHVYGPGLFAEQGEKGSLDMITGEETTGTLSLQSEHLGAGKDYITLLLVGSKVA